MASGKKITINDMSIYYETHGSGPSVVLLIHGAVGKWNCGLVFFEDPVLKEDHN